MGKLLQFEIPTDNTSNVIWGGKTSEMLVKGTKRITNTNVYQKQTKKEKQNTNQKDTQNEPSILTKATTTKKNQHH